MKKPINVYWSPSFDLVDKKDWTFLYPKPEVLFSNILKNKNKDIGDSSFFACPALSNKFKKMLVFKNSLSCSYAYSEDEDPYILPTTEQYLSIFRSRENSINDGPIYKTGVSYLFFADEPLSVSFTPAYFHKPGFTKYASIIPGEFDIGQWFRPYAFEFQTWNKSGQIVLEEDEPLFYAEFKTERPIVLHRFNHTEILERYSLACIDTTSLFGRGQNLQSRYNRFRSVGLKEKIMTEIQQNLIIDEKIKF